MSKVLALLIALFQAIPSIQKIVEKFVEQWDKMRKSHAARRKEEKDNAVDASIDNP